MEFWVEDEGLEITSWRSGSPQPGTLYDRSYLEKKDKYSAFLGGNQPLCVIRNESQAGHGKILLIRDSYSDALAPSWPSGSRRSICWTPGTTGPRRPSTRRTTASTPWWCSRACPTLSPTGTWCC